MSRWRSHSGEDRFLSAAGVEWVAVLVLVGFRACNVIQFGLGVGVTYDRTRHPAMDFALLAVFLVSSALVVAVAVKNRRLQAEWMCLDVLTGTGILLLTPLVLMPDQLNTWASWAFPSTLCTSSLLATIARPRLVVIGTAVLMGSYLTWLGPTRAVGAAPSIAINSIAYPVFAVLVFWALRYLRRLAALADEGRLAAEELGRFREQENTRRVLHTPYRLLRDLETELRDRLSDGGHDPVRSAQLAEAVASIREVEATVRGTTPATGNLHRELRELGAQFTDMPLTLNLDGLDVELEENTVYRLREAVRSALQNVRHHAQATRVTLFGDRDGDQWTLSVHDDGIGISTSAVPRLGTSLIVDEPTKVGCEVTITSGAGGTLVEIRGHLEQRPVVAS
jgi:hypothetical protein